MSIARFVQHARQPNDAELATVQKCDAAKSADAKPRVQETKSKKARVMRESARMLARLSAPGAGSAQTVPRHPQPCPCLIKRTQRSMKQEQPQNHCCPEARRDMLSAPVYVAKPEAAAHKESAARPKPKRSPTNVRLRAASARRAARAKPISARCPPTERSRPAGAHGAALMPAAAERSRERPKPPRGENHACQTVIRTCSSSYVCGA